MSFAQQLTLGHEGLLGSPKELKHSLLLVENGQLNNCEYVHTRRQYICQSMKVVFSYVYATFSVVFMLYGM